MIMATPFAAALRAIDKAGLTITDVEMPPSFYLTVKSGNGKKVAVECVDTDVLNKHIKKALALKKGGYWE
jgi:hypothetical protein